MNLRSNIKNYLPALLILITLLTFTTVAYYQSKKNNEERRSRLFELRFQKASDAVSNRIQDYIQILKGCQGLFYASNSVTAQEWKKYTESLGIAESYAGFQGIAFAAFIPKEHFPQLVSKIRSEGHPDFQIKSDFKASFLAPIIYIEPFSGRNLRAFGYDMYSEPNRREAMDRALISGKAALTRKVTLVQENGQKVQPGFLMYYPVYKDPSKAGSAAARRRNIRGFVYYPFRAHNLMNTISKQFDDLNISIFDGEKAVKSKLLYKPDVTGSGKTGINEFKRDTLLKLAGTTWRMRVSNTERFGSQVEKLQPLLILIFGIASSVLVFLIALNVIRRKSQIAHELTLSKAIESKKDEFIGIASHELKTPLTSIKAYVQLLEKANLKQPEQNFVQKARSNVNKLQALINDLLDVSKIEAGKLQFNFSPFRLSELIETSIENVQHMHHSHQIIRPEIIPDILLNGDLLRLEQALTNLLINAVKYSPGASSVRVELEHTASEVKIRVIDYGLGITPENQKNIFNRFFRAEELSPVLSGLGMGLYISSEIVHRHGGTITVQSEPGKGSTFTIKLPVV